MKSRHCTSRLRACLAGLGAALVAVPAWAADIVDIRWSPQGRFEHRAEIVPGRFVEACGALPPGTEVRWSFEGSAPLDFNVHWHEGRKVVMPDKRDGVARGDGTLRVATTHDICWMWTHKAGAAAPAVLTLTLQR